nr:hypothetical protein [Rhizobium hidalgonense]
MGKVEILTGADRQRRWSTVLKLSILQEAFGADGTCFGCSAPARRSSAADLRLAKEALATRISPGGIVHPGIAYRSVGERE